MITFENNGDYFSIEFDPEDLAKMKLIFDRAINTLSPPDDELIEVYDEICKALTETNTI